MTARLPTHHELTNLYSRAEVRACLGWSDEKLRRRLLKLRDVRPSGNGRGQQFTGAQIWAIYNGGIACEPTAAAGSKSTRPGRSEGAPAGTSAGKTCTAGRSKAGSRRKSLLRELLDGLPDGYLETQTVVPLHPSTHRR